MDGIEVINPIWFFLMTLACFAGVIVSSRRLRGLKAADKIIKQQRYVVEPQYAANMAGEVAKSHKAEWDRLVSQITGPEGPGVLRYGHLIWMAGVIEDGNPDSPIPSFAPEPGAPYEILEDVGLPFYRQYMVAMADGKLMDAYRFVREGSEAGSALCMATYGQSLAEGKVPGLAPDPSAVSWIERAIELGSSAQGLAELLLEGVYVPQDVSRGLALLREEAAAGGDIAAVDLALILAEGKYGITQDLAEARRWALKQAPRWRRLADKIGISQAEWAQAFLRALAKRKKDIEETSPWEQQQIGKRMTRNMRR